MVKDATDSVVKAIIAEKDFLSQLDAKIGDGDHGLNMARGATAAMEVLEELDGEEDLKKVLREIGEAVVMNVGGSAGPLYGAGLIAASRVIDENSSLDAVTLEKVFGAIVEEIQKRGRAEKGDKTMLDVWIPIHDAFKPENAAGKSLEEVLDAAISAARDGVEYTKTIAAKRGRASYLGDKSIGYEDPGAYSSLIIYRTLSGYWRQLLKEN